MDQFFNVSGQLLEGFGENCIIFIVTLLAAIPLGLIISMGSMSKFKPLKWLTKTFVWIIRGTPLMLQLFVVFYVPPLVSNGSVTFARMNAALIAFIINYAAYFSEIFRGGIESVPKGQYEAGQVLGMTKGQIFFKVVLLQVVCTDGLVDRGAAVQLIDDELAQRFLLFGDDADAALLVVVENEMVQNDAVEIRAEDTQNHGFLVVDKRGGQRHAHTGQRHGPAQIHAQVFVQDLRHDIQPAGRRVPVEENAQADADDQNVAEHVQLLTAGHGFKIRENKLKKP